MTMPDQNETPNPKPKRKQTRRRKVSAAAPKQAPAEFAGLSPTDCCNDCDKKHCVISGVDVCGHPMKGGLQAAQMGEADTVKRYQRAKRFLANAKLELRDA